MKGSAVRVRASALQNLQAVCPRDRVGWWCSRVQSGYEAGTRGSYGPAHASDLVLRRRRSAPSSSSPSLAPHGRRSSIAWSAVYEVDFLPVGQAGRHGDAIAIRFTRPDTGGYAHNHHRRGARGTATRAGQPDLSHVRRAPRRRRAEGSCPADDFPSYGDASRGGMT